MLCVCFKRLQWNVNTLEVPLVEQSFYGPISTEIRRKLISTLCKMEKVLPTSVRTSETLPTFQHDLKKCVLRKCLFLSSLPTPLFHIFSILYSSTPQKTPLYLPFHMLIVTNYYLSPVLWPNHCALLYCCLGCW